MRATAETGGRTVHRVFTGRDDGDFAIASNPRQLADNRARVVAYPWTWLEQVHGAGVVVVSRPGQFAGARCDASVTSAPGAVLAVQTADCAPVLLWAEGPSPSAGPVIGAAHAGWRGLYEGVIEAVVDAMRSLGAGEITAHLGPTISPAAYEFGERDLTTMALRFGPDVIAATGDGHAALDVRAAVASALAASGVGMIDDHVDCTATTVDADGRPRYYSHRARGDQGRQASVIWIEP